MSASPIEGNGVAPASSLECPPPYRLRLGGVDDVVAFRAHLLSTTPDNGRDGAWAAPFLEADQRARFTPEREQENRVALGRQLDEAGWLRMVLAELDGAVIGHADLKGGNIPSEMHRCTLGLGVGRSHHRRGLGEALTRAAISWARAAGLDWLDLGVFAGNEPAIALYRKLGFVETGRVVDRFRVGDVALTDIAMSLRL